MPANRLALYAIPSRSRRGMTGLYAVLKIKQSQPAESGEAQGLARPDPCDSPPPNGAGEGGA